jgi:hypothetical protein
MTHLTPDELIDAVDAALPPVRRAHLDTCEHCHREAARLHALLADVRHVDVPEPSPLFWDQFSARVHSAIARESTPGPPRRWFHWPVLAPVAGLAVVVLALVSSLPDGSTETTHEPVALVASNTAADDDGDVELQWQVLADLVGEFDIETAHEAGIPTAPGTADTAILRLTLGEQQELMRLLREELRAGG